MASAVTVGQATSPRFSAESSPSVVDCYDVLDLCLAGGVDDFTDGIYEGDRLDRQSYLEAQLRQAEYLLDQLDCYPGERILDIGCGYGRILQEAGRRDINAVGITLSPGQAAACQEKGLSALVLNYRDLPRKGGRRIGRVNGIVANGSIEHFVQLEDAVAGRSDLIYGELFDICRKQLAPGDRLVTTTIHFREKNAIDPRAIRRGQDWFQRGSFGYHFANLVEAFGGWYPEPGQLEHCAEGRFVLVCEQDGTHDYFLTSEYWLRRLKWSLAINPSVWWALARKWLTAPRALSAMMRCLLVDQSWNWQFRSDGKSGNSQPPMQLLRQTWQAI